MVAIYTTRDPSGLMACQRALAAADAQGDEAAACTALGMLGNWLAEAGDRAASDHYAIEAVERAQRTGNPELATAGVVCAAANYLWTSTEPDFARSFDMLSRYDTGSHPQDAATTLWYDLQLGTTLDGLGKPGARRHLIAAYRLADRQAALHAQDLTLRILALHLAKGGDFAGAARLLGYSDANFRPFRIETPVHAWLERGIDTAMGQWRDRAEHEAAGRGASRHQIIALLNDLEMMTPTT
jgi:hypothetical protein